MKIKDSSEELLKDRIVRRLQRHSMYRVAGAVLYSLAFFLFGAYVHKTGLIRETVKPMIRQNAALIPKLIRGMLSKPERIVIDIKYKDFQRLAYQREIALSKGVLITSDEDYVPGVIRHRGQSIKVKLRLKGDWTDHLAGDKWSFRIKVKGDDTLFGMKRFSIHHPKTRSYINEWFFHRALRREGVLGLRYDFITVTLNGKDLGVYAIEEHFGKRLIENNELREGPIVRFNEDLLWREKVQQRLRFPEALANGTGFYLSSEVDGFQSSRWLSDQQGSVLYLKAIYLLESFRRGLMKASDVFDAEKFARYLALSDLLGAQHSALWHNQRFYYNPISSRLEPIGFDGDTGRRIEYLIGTSPGVRMGDSSLPYENNFAMMFRDMKVVKEYVGTLERISQRDYLDRLFGELDEEMSRKLDILYSEFPYYEFSKDVFYRNQEYIRSVLNPVKGLHAYFYSSFEGGIELQLGNLQRLPLEILSVSYVDSALFRLEGDGVLRAGSDSKPIQYHRKRFAFPREFVWRDSMVTGLKINYRIVGSNKIRSEQVYSRSYLGLDSFQEDLPRKSPNVEGFSFLLRDDGEKKIIIRPGTWKLTRDLIIPSGYRVICGPGTRLELSDSASILSYSPIEFLGEKENPIVVHSADSTGQGFVVMNAAGGSIVRFVVFENLSNPSQQEWSLTGSVTFYESRVKISDSQFIKNRSEDALNIVRSEFEINRTIFRGTLSDALDADFSSGQVKNSSFVECGNDAIDASGGVVEVNDVLIDGTGDKGLSAGENSRIIVTKMEIRNAEVAVASKDMSLVTMQGIDISDSKVGFTVYQKKSEFGPASITAEGVSIKNSAIPYLVEENSILVVDGKTIEPSRDNVKALLYGTLYGKSSK